MSQSDPKGGGNNLRAFLWDAVANRMDLRQQAMQRTLETMVRDLEQKALRADSARGADESQIRSDVEAVEARRQRIEARIERLQRQADGFVGTILRDRLLRQVEAFNDRFETRLPSELESIKDVNLLRQHLAGYIETAWKSFLDRAIDEVQTDLSTESASMVSIIEQDVAELLSTRPEVKTEFSDLGLDPNALQVSVPPSEADRGGINIASRLNLRGISLPDLSPILGILPPGSERAVQRILKGGIGSGNREAVVRAGCSASRELASEVKQQIEGQLKALSQRLQDQIANAYWDAFTEIRELLDSRGDVGRDVVSQRAGLKSIIGTTLPSIREQVDRLGREK